MSVQNKIYILFMVQPIFGNMGKTDFKKVIWKCLIQFAMTVFCEINIRIVASTINYLLSLKSRIEVRLELTGIFF